MSDLDSFLLDAFYAAENSGHVFPAFAACEAALESNWGRSALAKEANNLFGTKQHQHPVFGTLNMPTHEWDKIKHSFIVVNAEWVKYPGWKECFEDRMSTLTRLAPEYPHYAAALAAPDGETFVREVSRTWSTDPNRADKVLSIYRNHKDDLQ